MICQNCGAEVKDSAAFCGNCGSKITVPEPVPEPASEPELVHIPDTYVIPETEDPVPEVSVPVFEPEPIPEPVPEIVYSAPEPEPVYTGPEPEYIPPPPPEPVPAPAAVTIPSPAPLPPEPASPQYAPQQYASTDYTPAEYTPPENIPPTEAADEKPAAKTGLRTAIAVILAIPLFAFMILTSCMYFTSFGSTVEISGSLKEVLWEMGFVEEAFTAFTNSSVFAFAAVACIAGLIITNIILLTRKRVRRASLIIGIVTILAGLSIIASRWITDIDFMDPVLFWAQTYFIALFETALPIGIIVIAVGVVLIGLFVLIKLMRAGEPVKPYSGSRFAVISGVILNALFVFGFIITSLIFILS